MHKPTLNQIIILLDCRRGSFDPARHMGNVDKEAQGLVMCNLIKMSKDPGRYELTTFGTKLADHIMEESKYEIRLIPGRFINE